MTHLPILTLDLARRIERRVAPEVTPPGQRPEPGAATVAKFGSAIAAKARGGRPRNQVFCFGHADLDRLEEILAFYAVDNLEPCFYLAPMGFTREVAGALDAAGFVQREFEQAILYGLPAPEVPLPPPGVSIERVTAANLEEFVRTTAEGFEWPPEWRDAAMDGLRRAFRPESYRFLARFKGEPAGVGSLRGVRDRIANLGGGAVVPLLRGKGCHLALVQHRLKVAHTLDCEWIQAGATFGSASFRNQQRAGLRLAYIESGWSRGPAGAG